MVFNESFSALFASPASLKKANDSFNESFGDKTTLSPSTIFRILQKEHDQISSVLRFHPPTSSQYQNSLIELISLFERAEDQSTEGFQKLTLSIFLKLAANLLTGLIKPKNQPTLYKLAQLIAASVVPDLGVEYEIEERQMRKWADRVVIECSIHLLDFPNYQLDLEFDTDSIVDDLGLANGRFQFVKSSIFEAARSIAVQMPTTDTNFVPESRFQLENVADEPFLQLLMWIFLRKRNVFNGDLLTRLFPNFPQTPVIDQLVKSPVSILDVKLYLVSLAVISSTTTESGMTAKNPPAVAAQLTLTKQQKECWKAVVALCNGKPVTALTRLRVAQITDSVRLTSDGSEDVRVLFESWKCCLQPSAAQDEHVFAATKAITEIYRTKMNSILAYGPFYSSDPSSFLKQTSGARRDMKALFPLQFDYEFVDTTEAGHIGVVINSLEGYLSVAPDATTDRDVSFEDASEGDQQPLDLCGDDTFHSFATASSGGANNSQFFSPMRPSMCPTAISQLIREDCALNTSHISTQSVILTPTRQQQQRQANANLSISPVKSTSSTSVEASQMQIPTGLSFERLQTFQVSTPKKTPLKNTDFPPKLKYFDDDYVSDDEEEYISDEEADPLEAALLESTQKHQESLLVKKSPKGKTPTKPQDAQTETDDAVTSSEESSIVTVRYTPKRSEEAKALMDKVVKEEEEELEITSDGEMYSGEDEEEDYEEEEEEEEEEDEEEGLTEEMEEEIFMGTLEASALMYRDHHMNKYGILEQKIDYDNMSEDEFVREAEDRLAKMKIGILNTVKRLEERMSKPLTFFSISTDSRPDQVFGMSD